MAQHRARGEGRTWSGTPADVVRLAHEGEKIVRSASHGGHTAKIFIKFFKGRRESDYESPEEFVAGLSPSDIPQVRSLMILWIDHSPSHTPGDLVASVDLVRGFRERPFVTATADDPSIVDGVQRRIAAMFNGRGWWQGLRRQEQSRWQRLRARAGGLLPLAVTAAVTAAVTVIATIFATKLITGH